VQIKQYPFLLLFILSVQLFSQQVSIHGEAKAFAGKPIYAFAYDDCITFNKNILEQDTVSANGKFNLHFDTRDVQRIYLSCEHLKAPLYIQPGKSYEVVFPQKDSSRMFNRNVDQDGDLYINTSDSTELNWLIMDFNMRYDQFWTKNYQNFVIKKTRFVIDSFKRAINIHYQHVASPYFHAYIDYSIASTQVSTFESKNFLAKDYLINKKIGYHNFEYMNFFNQFFDKYFYQFASSPKGIAVNSAINDNGSTTELMAALKTAPYLQNDTLRELVMLKGLYENYTNKEFITSRMLSILEQVSRESKIKEHRLIARNIIAAYSVLKKGTPAPAFNLADRNEKTVYLSDFKGRFVYLTFASSLSTDCIREQKYMEELKKKYPKIQMITICTDEKVQDMNLLLKQNPKLNWTFLYAGNNEKLKHDYQIFSVPFYYLINPDGLLLLSPAPAPYDGIEEVFYNITKKKFDSMFKLGDD
jgi:hypothetical protein